MNKHLGTSRASTCPRRQTLNNSPNASESQCAAMSQKISTGWYFFLFTLVGSSSGLIYTVFQGDGEPLVASLGFSGIAFAGTFALISWLGDAFKKVGLKGKDISKSDRREL